MSDAGPAWLQNACFQPLPSLGASKVVCVSLVPRYWGSVKSVWHTGAEASCFAALPSVRERTEAAAQVRLMGWEAGEGSN